MTSFGSGQRLSPGSFVALGLLTFWIYTAVRLARAVSLHFALRWAEVEGSADLSRTDARLAALRVTGFTTGRAAPWGAAVLFALSAILLAAWFYKRSVILAGAASALFYAGTVLLVLWTFATIRRHEMLEFLVRERGARGILEQPEVGDAVERRWERHTSHVVAFLALALTVAVAVALPPMVGAQPALGIAAVALFHVWGTLLLVGLYNSHLAEERRHVFTAPLQPGDQRATADADAPPQRARVAIMLTDMQDYSKSMGLDESGTYARLVDHNRIMRDAIAAHRGREIKTIGDAFLVIFRSARRAVDCALAAQRGFAQYNAGKREDQRILVRIGIHFGDVLLTPSDVFGDGVNVAARIEPLAVPGGVCVSDAVFERVRKKMPLNAQPLEGVTLKNIARPPKLYRIRA
jgi:class 3 adenylate cyclase